MSFIDDLRGKPRSDDYDRSSLRPHTPAALPPRREQQVRPVDTVPADIAVEEKKPAPTRNPYDREMSVAKEVWRLSVLPKALKASWNHAEKLQVIILRALDDGFSSDVIAAAEQLHKLDARRGICPWATALKNEGRLDEAENTIRNFTAKFGENGVVVMLLARIYLKRNDSIRTGQLLWRALELDPNLDGGIAWYASVQRDRGGEAAWLEALRKIANLPKSWRAQLWLARLALDAKHLEQALAYYQESLSRAEKPVPADLLTQLSGDLGHAGYLPELLELTEPHFEALLHGLPVGNNLIKAHLNLGRLDSARRIMDQLQLLKRAEWQKTLSFWDAEITQANGAPVNIPMDEKIPA